ncbi:MAG: bifunctional 3-(3-hydroxy-phenyl)propionate/3-hydroxycinnamic acid hydroxylase [Acetobacteraceae bacterium]|nr:bifunctional 3-(3-hydroxy-phenyl)propionate/3-hydroxycinnamic acid hydroxylase [Acetobacteraceae bacterium]
MPNEIGIHSRFEDTEVAIVGAGPVGLMIANLLGTAGVRVTVLERNKGLLNLPRAIAYDGETLRLFTQVGLFEQIAPGLIPNPRVRHLNARRVALMEADSPARGLYGHSALGTFYQPNFENVLLNGLSRFDAVRVLFEHTVTDLTQDAKGVELKISSPQGERKLRAQFAIGCDGGTSGVRTMLGVRLVGSTYTERWLVVDAIVKNHGVSQITFHCDPRRPRVELPVVGDRVRWEFMQLPGESEEVLKNDDTVRKLVTQYTMYGEFEIERKAVYTFHARVADHWRRGRVFLAGDAAHLMPPFAGQGMNGGLKDAVNLSWKLVAVLRGQAPDSILDSYEAERAPVVRRIVEVSRRLGSVIMPTSRIAAAARDSLFAGLNLSRRFRAFIGAGKIVPRPAIGRSVLTAAGRDALIGQMVPQPMVSSAQGIGLLDQHVSGHQWMALGINEDPALLLSNRDLAILDALGARFICLNGASLDRRTLALRCADQGFIRWAEQHQVGAVLVRPDRFIAARLDPGSDLEPLSPFASLDWAEILPIAA